MIHFPERGKDEKIADLFRIRIHFDVDKILLPMCILSRASISRENYLRIKKNRSDLMGKVFYKFVSSTEGKAQIDRHLIVSALDQWSWYWIVLEAAVTFLLTSVIFIIFGNYMFGYWFLVSVLLFVSFSFIIYNNCERYALNEVKEILADQTRVDEVRSEFNAL